MLEFRLKQPLIKPPYRAPKLNLAHPLYSPHCYSATVAQGAGIRDLVTGASAGGSTTLSGVDEGGPYVWSNDAAGTAICALTPASVSYSFFAWGCIFKLMPGTIQYHYIYQAQSGVLVNGTSIDFYLANGNIIGFTGAYGHIYFACQNQSVATATLIRTCTLVDLNTGRIFQELGASSGAITSSTIAALTNYSTDVNNTRFYCGFAMGSTTVPPAVNPAPPFWSADQILAGARDPWSFWHG